MTKALVFCKVQSVMRIIPVVTNEVRANSVPAAAVRQSARALFVMIGCKGYVGGF